jgi:hypothetical protein
VCALSSLVFIIIIVMEKIINHIPPHTISVRCNDYGELGTDKLVKGFKLLGVELSDEEEGAFLSHYRDEESFTLEEFVEELNHHEEKEEEKFKERRRSTLAIGGGEGRNANANFQRDAISKAVWTKIVGVAENEPYLWNRALKMLFVFRESEDDAGCIETKVTVE